MGHQKRSFVKKTIDKPHYPTYSTTRPLKVCHCNSCKGKLVDPRTRSAHMLKKNTTSITRNYHDAGESSSKTTFTFTSKFPEMDIPEELPEMDVQELLAIDIANEDPMHIDSSDNDFIISSYENDFSFIAKSQSQRGKKPAGNGGKRSTQNLILVE